MMKTSMSIVVAAVTLASSVPPAIPGAEEYGALVLDLDDNGIHTSNVLYAPVAFDLNADGVPEDVGWLAPASEDAFLWIDLNGDGVPNNGAELFGEHSALPGGQTADNGMEALAAYDDNADGKINADDAVWARLLLWNDRDHSGTLSQGEGRTVSSSRVVGFLLDYSGYSWGDGTGNYHSYQTAYWTRPGRDYRRHVMEYILFAVQVTGNDRSR